MNPGEPERAPLQRQGDLSELRALVSLIDEPDERNFAHIRERILAWGDAAIPELEAAFDRHFQDGVQQRLVDLIQEIQYGTLYHELEAWAAGGGLDLLEGFLLVSRFQYPNLDDVEVRTRIDQIARDVWLEINEGLTALEKVKVINHVLFDIHGFAPNKAEQHTPQNFFINTLLETRKGSPVSLGALYLMIAQKLDIPIYGVNLAQHFILAYTEGHAVVAGELPGAEQVLFYLNPFNHGTVFTRSEIELFLRHMKISPEPSHYTPCSNKVIIRRLLTNLVFTYESLKKKEKAGELGRLLGLLD
ncbi:MAG TPA: transglutaminase-like domain-containing protein [Bacteroidales bacterium]|nr:transglutaminase-like domain-containing protein [Bacteroidales bacterium]HRZ76788.1 transglutaminase-like domain-containing protein [Bacteroidales bacterium]